MKNNKYDLTISMIVKNEEKYLEKCLRALVPLKDEISCEIIVTDTGSIDSTVEIAKKYADKVLHFEWCNDFSKARNVGVEASQGKWFMVVDADEIFDDSIIEIAKFIKSSSRDNYDHATFIQRNVKAEDNIDIYRDYNAGRIYNFTKEKRFFFNKIHETVRINKDDKQIILKAIAYHYGYINSKEKKERNKPLLLNEFKENPYNIRTINNLIVALPNEEILEYTNYAFKIIEENNNNLVNMEYYPSVCRKAIMVHYCNEDYALAIEVFKQYLNSNYLKSLENTCLLPNLDLYNLYGVVLFKNKNYKESIEAFIEYQRIYLELKVCPDVFYSTFDVYTHNCEKEYQNAFIYCLVCYSILKDNDNAVKILKNHKFYTFKEDNDYTFLNKYIEYSIKYNQFNLVIEAIDYSMTNENVFFDNEFYLIFYASFISSYNFDKYIKKCSIDVLDTHIFNIFNKLKFIDFDKIYEIIKNKKEYSSLKEMKFYLNLMFYFIINKSLKDLNENYDHITLNEIFEMYIKSVYLYVKTVYNTNIIANNQFELLDKPLAFCCEIYPNLESKNDNILAYMKSLKKALIYCPEFKEAVTNSIDILQKELNDDNKNPVNTDNEFKMISEKIKLTIIELIKSNDMEQASIILQQYKTINPTDLDIANLENVINN